jgi:hypothetical protein
VAGRGSIDVGLRFVARRTAFSGRDVAPSSSVGRVDRDTTRKFDLAAPSSRCPRVFASRPRACPGHSEFGRCIRSALRPLGGGHARPPSGCRPGRHVRKRPLRCSRRLAITAGLDLAAGRPKKDGSVARMGYLGLGRYGRRHRGRGCRWSRRRSKPPARDEIHWRRSEDAVNCGSWSRCLG